MFRIVYNAQGYAAAIWASTHHRVRRLHNRPLESWNLTANDLQALPDFWHTICSDCGVPALSLTAAGPNRRVCGLCNLARSHYAAAV